MLNYFIDDNLNEEQLIFEFLYGDKEERTFKDNVFMDDSPEKALKIDVNYNVNYINNANNTSQNELVILNKNKSLKLRKWKCNEVIRIINIEPFTEKRCFNQ